MYVEKEPQLYKDSLVHPGIYTNFSNVVMYNQSTKIHYNLKSTVHSNYRHSMRH